MFLPPSFQGRSVEHLPAASFCPLGHVQTFFYGRLEAFEFVPLFFGRPKKPSSPFPRFPVALHRTLTPPPFFSFRATEGPRFSRPFWAGPLPGRRQEYMDVIFPEDKVSHPFLSFPPRTPSRVASLFLSGGSSCSFDWFSAGDCTKPPASL